VHCVLVAGVIHSSLVFLHEPSLHKTGVPVSGHLVILGQSSKLLLQSPLGHLIGIKEGHVMYSGHSSTFETQELSPHLTLITEVGQVGIEGHNCLLS
jgi:hypothetical protein